MSEILSTGIKLWSIKDDYDELQTKVFEEIAGTSGKSNMRLISELIENINTKLDGYYFEYSDNRLYICKQIDENIKKYPISIIDENGHVASKVDGSTITIDESGIIHGTTIDNILSDSSTNPVQNKIIKGKIDTLEEKIGENTSNIAQNASDIASNTSKITENETAISSEKLRAETAENQLKTALEDGKKVWDDKYTKTEVDNKLSTLETNIDWKESVGTFNDIATTYPNPDDGWTVNTKDKNYTYRYDGSKWIAISANAIPKATNELDGIMSKEDKAKLDNIDENIVSKLGESPEGTFTYNGSEIKAKTDRTFDTLKEAQEAMEAGEIEEGTSVYVKEGTKDAIGVAKPKKAGLVMPDDETIAVDQDGTLHIKDEILKSYAKGCGITFGITDAGILTATYDDGQ